MKKWFLAPVLLTALSATAHEFWMLPDRFAPPLNSPVRLSISVGENFQGDAVGISRPLVATLRHYAKGGVQDLKTQVPEGPAVGSLPIAFAQPGAQLIALDTQPNTIELSADKFHAYLREEGLESVIQQREASGQAALPGRERYRRHVKTLLRAGGVSDASYAVPTGQRLEIAPLADPHAQAGGGDVAFKVKFEDKPLAGALAKAWHQRSNQLVILRARTDVQGRVTFSLPWAGRWMVSLVHMTPATDATGIDWDSYWGNLTFELPARR